MWPYRPSRLTELLEAREIANLLGQGVVQLLGSDITLIEPNDEGSPQVIECSPEDLRPHESPFCHYFRHGRSGNKLAFDGADAECAKCELKFAARVLGSLRSSGADAREDITSARCHIGLLDFAAPVLVRGVPLATLVAGRRVESDDDRSRIAKRVGKLGKLTRGEVRSMEESGAKVVASIVPRDDKARAALLEEIPKIPKLDAAFGEQLLQTAKLIGMLAEGRLDLARRSWEDGALASVVAEGAELPQRRGHVLNWAESAVRRLHRVLRNEFVALFARLPEDLGKSEQPLRLLCQSGLAPTKEAKLRSEEPLMTLDVRCVVEQAETLDECVERALDGVSSLIGALDSAPSCPTAWKDSLTKSVFVATCRESPGLEVVVAFGPPASATDKLAPEPNRADHGFLWRAARRVAERYLLAACDSVRRGDAARLDKLEKAAEARKPTGPLRPQRFDVRKLIDAELAAASPRAESRQVSFETQGLPERVMLEADRPKLKDVLECLLDHIVGFAVPDPDRARPSVLVSMKRDRRSRHRWTLVFDVVGRFLTRDEQRRLFTEGSKRVSSNGDGKDGEESEPRPASERAGPITFREAQQNVSWHGGRLKVESERIGANGSASTSGSDAPTQDGAPTWTGRTLFTLEIPERPPRSLPQNSPRSPPQKSPRSPPQKTPRSPPKREARSTDATKRTR